jgi:hypothetical protein
LSLFQARGRAKDFEHARALLLQICLTDATSNTVFEPTVRFYASDATTKLFWIPLRVASTRFQYSIDHSYQPALAISSVVDDSIVQTASFFAIGAQSYLHSEFPESLACAIDGI